MRASTPPEPKTEIIDEDGVPQAGGAGGHSVPARSDRIGGRYQVLSELGRGGMAVVYRVTDTKGGRELALKQLTLAGNERRDRDYAAAFEREYHTLVQLSHPRIIEVYDFGADDAGRYYTMELLDGGDLRERAPLPWQQACALGHDVCSSLALLHSRRLVHRDISPRNVRGTRAGSAKLIDFGAMVPMGTSGQIVGTPPFVPPEVLHRSTLDARTDLFSFGATLYFALTGRLAFPARDFSRLHEVWQQRPPPPSAIVPEIPAALDALVMSLISLDPALRPRTAFEVMQRLAALAGLAQAEAEDVTQAYLSTPVMVGRDEPLAALRARIAATVAGRGAGVLIQGPAGVGRTRMLDACALEAKIAGAVVLRANAASEGSDSLAIGQTLADQLLRALPDLSLATARKRQVVDALFEDAATIDGGALPEHYQPRLKNLAGNAGDRPVVQSALTGWLLQAGTVQTLAVLVDDLDKVDEASLSLLAALVLAAPSRRLIVIATAETGAPVRAADAFGVLKRDCVRLELPELSHEHTESLLTSLFGGDVPNVSLVSDRLFAAAGGNPRETLELVQALIARGTVRYQGGHWVLPGRLDPAELPSSAADACRQRIAELSPLARQVAEVHALASHPTLSRQDYALACGDIGSAQLDEAISELVTKRIIAGDGLAYVLSRREWAGILNAALDEDTRAARHRMLAEIYAKDAALRVERAFHLFAGRRDELGIDLLLELLTARAGDSQGILSLTSMSAERVASLLDRAFTSAERLGRPPRQVHEIRRGLFSISIVADEACYFKAAPALLAELKRDSGLAFYEAITDAPDPGTRLMRALTQASERFNATKEADRVLGPEQAIKDLAYYVAISIAIGSRTQDVAMIASLPALLEPFAPLSPVLHAIWQNAIATGEANRGNQPERAHARWLEVDAVLAKVSATEVPYVAPLRGAIAYGIALIEARLGLMTAEDRARVLDDDPFQRASAMSLRRIARLHQGDYLGAERFRKRAELLALHGNLRQMFTSTLSAELIAHAMAGDLTGIRESAQAIEPLAERFPGWRAHRHLAEGYFEQTRGQFEAALEAFGRGLALAEPDDADPSRATGAWPRLEGAYMECLLSLGRAEEARARGRRAVETCTRLAIEAAGCVVSRTLAMAEAKLGDYAGACARLDAVVACLQARGIRGLELGATYEARARAAIWASDTAAIEQYGRLTAQEYRHGQGSPLGARYERLMDEARTSGVSVLPQLSEFVTKLSTMHWRGLPVAVTQIRERLAEANSAGERAERALQLLCEARAASSGYLYLSTGEGLQLVAARGPSKPGDALREFVARYVGEQLEADNYATVVETAGATTAGAACWLDPRGVAHHTSLLMAEVDGMKVCAGAAVLEGGTQFNTEVSTQVLLDTLGEYLLLKGDARAMKTASA